MPLPLVLDKDAPGPWGSRLAALVREQVLSGVLAAGERLPSSRALAAELGTSRSVVESAYEQLLAEGWVRTRRGSGTFVAPGARHGVPGRPVPPRTAPAAGRVRLDTGTPWVDLQRSPGWRRAWREVSATRPPRGYDDHRGAPALREQLAAHLARARGLVVDPDDVRVCSGTVDGLRLVLQALGPGDVAVEDPGYRAAVALAEVLGRRVRDLPVGAPVHDLGGCAAAYVTPAHQHPLGRVMPAGERVALLEAAREAGAVVVEDDYDSELRYDVAPVPALAALDREQVVYLGTASKSVAPSLRLGWLVAPPRVTERIDRWRALTHDGAPWPVQQAFSVLLRDGQVERAVRAARRVYAERAPRVVAALSPHATLAGPAAGMYTTWLLDADRAEAARAAAAGAGFEVPLLAGYARSSPLTGLVVGFGGVTDAELDRALAVLGTALDRTR